jgi:hypothetical protein
MIRFGVSFSVKQCRNFELKYDTVLRALIKDLGVRRFRLMSYWNEHEKTPGEYDFTVLDKQIDLIEKASGAITLCLGVRQPRWPENHWPDWAWDLPKPERDAALLKFIEQVVERYKNRSIIVSYQLENEALLSSFGERSEVDLARLKMEYFWVKVLDKTRPIIMTTTTSWGVPVKQPIPDIVGFSYYQKLYRKGKYRRSFHRPWLDRWRARLVKLLHGNPSFIHELQAEPWGPKNIWEMDLEEQFKSMSLKQLQKNIRQAKKTGLYPIDLWGAEWWYWLKTQKKNPEAWNALKDLFGA